MSSTGPALSLTAMFAGRESRRRKDRGEEEQLQRRQEEEPRVVPEAPERIRVNAGPYRRRSCAHPACVRALTPS